MVFASIVAVIVLMWTRGPRAQFGLKPANERLKSMQRWLYLL